MKTNKKFNRKETVITIKQLLERGMMPLEVAKTLGVSFQLVYKWRNKDPSTPRKKRKSKLK